MSDSYFDPDWSVRVAVSVKRVCERWACFYGYPIDDLRSGSQAEGGRHVPGGLQERVEQTLGRRPAPTPKSKKR